MSVTNPWLTPYQRSYQQIKAKLIEDLKQIKGPNGNVLITDYSEGNILIMLISLFSAIAEVLHYYIDNMSRETFFSTARRFDSLVKHGELVDYHAHGAVASTVDIIISRPINSSSLSSDILIPKDTVFIDTSGNSWLVEKDTKWYANTTNVTIPCIQHTLVENTSMTNVTIPNFKVMKGDKPRLKVTNTFSNGKFYEHGTMSIRIGDDDWILVETFAFSNKYDKHFRVEIENNSVYILFGDGQHGMIPNPGYFITRCTYYITSGSAGNVASGAISNIPNSIQTSAIDAICSNPHPASGGSDYEDFDMLKEHIPLHVRTLGVAITKQDFIDLAKNVPGVNKVALEYECGRKLNLYITPDNGVVASKVLLERVYEYIKQHSPLTTWLNVKPVGEVNIILDIEVTGKKNYSESEIQSQVRAALLDRYSVNNSEIGGSVRISDIYALIDNLPCVDYLHINKFYLKPWPQTVYGSTPLKIDNFTVDKAKGVIKYLVVFNDANNYTLYSITGGFTTRGRVGNSLTVDDLNNGMKFGINILPNNYTEGNRYIFIVAAPNFDYTDPGFNLPTFTDVNQLKLKINEVL